MDREAATVTDFYEVTMALAYLREGLTEPATFSLFTRKLPKQWGFLVAAGLADVLDFLERFHVPRGGLGGFCSRLGLPGYRLGQAAGFAVYRRCLGGARRPSRAGG
ncbi:MAG TPA: hypothetical protein VFA63_06330 [Pseudonocardiaceae bacterium]|nr:hypothetical protein [Pseudonocardiaceae bacterium]